MADEEFPCRTKTISGTSYRIKMYLNGELRMSTSEDSEERANSFVQRMGARLPGYTFEVTAHPWTEEICIECGRESWQ